MMDHLGPENSVQDHVQIQEIGPIAIRKENQILQKNLFLLTKQIKNLKTESLDLLKIVMVKEEIGLNGYVHFVVKN